MRAIKRINEVFANVAGLIHGEGLSSNGQESGTGTQTGISLHKKVHPTVTHAILRGGDGDPSVGVVHRPRAADIGRDGNKPFRLLRREGNGVRAQPVPAGSYDGHGNIFVERRIEGHGPDVGNFTGHGTVAKTNRGGKQAETRSRPEENLHERVGAGRPDHACAEPDQNTNPSVGRLEKVRAEGGGGKQVGNGRAPDGPNDGQKIRVVTQGEADAVFIPEAFQGNDHAVGLPRHHGQGRRAESPVRAAPVRHQPQGQRQHARA